MQNETNNLPTTLNSRMEALRLKAAAELIEVWQPEPGETLVGVYTGHKQVEHPKYGGQWQLLLEDEAGTTTATWLNPWLRQNLKAQNLALGDLVAITYLGKRRTSTGNEYNAYSLIVDNCC